MNTDNRTNEPTEAMILAALNAYSSKGLEIDGYDPTDEYPSLDMWGERFASQMRAALVAAQGAARPVNGFDTSAERVKTGADSLHVAPQVPNQNETKSGNNFVSLDPEKVAEVLLANAKSRYGGLLFEERAAARIAHALCEAYMEGRLT